MKDNLKATPKCPPSLCGVEVQRHAPSQSACPGTFTDQFAWSFPQVTASIGHRRFRENMVGLVASDVSHVCLFPGGCFRSHWPPFLLCFIAWH